MFGKVIPLSVCCTDPVGAHVLLVHTTSKARLTVPSMDLVAKLPEIVERPKALPTNVS